MAKKKIPLKEKPREILELEKIYGIVLEERVDFSYGGSQKNSFSVDSNGNVVGISMFGNGIEDIHPIASLLELESLQLFNNYINDISSLVKLKKLRVLDLTENNVSDIKPLIHLAGSLEQLSISINPIMDFSPIGELLKLRELECNFIGVRSLDFVERLSALESINAVYNSILNIDKIQTLHNLRVLDFQKNLISDVSLLKNLEQLEYVDMSYNLIREIPMELARKLDWLNHGHMDALLDGISFEGNPLSYPPLSVIELGPDTTRNYYEMSEQFGHTPLSEGRIIFIGDGSAGKSSIIEKTLYNTFEKGREQTNGIKIEHMHLPHPEDQRDLVFHIWDFGGQEIQHAVHKFFFTEGCLYVLVLDNRKEEDPEYWLQQIESLGGKAPVLVVFNKQDENPVETADRKYLKEKYPNIVGFYNTSCQTGFGIDGFKSELQQQVVKLRTVEEQFPNNWLTIKKAIEERTSGSQHYLTYEVYQEICKQNHAVTEETQRLLLKYFNTIGAVTWFGQDTYLKFLHVLNPAWITQGVYKILTAKKTTNLFGQINISDFRELLQPVNTRDYTYDENHYGYILSMMKKFDLCYSPDDKQLLIPSAFGKEPKVEYAEFKGENVRTYILQFKDYMPLALIHRYTAKKLPDALDNNYWYTGIVIRDRKSSAVAMVHADKDAKKIYVRIKGDGALGLWEHVRRELAEITSSYAKIPYDELVALDEKADATVNYEDLIGHLQAGRKTYFHPRLKKDYNVGYLMGLFETTEGTLEKVKKGEIVLSERENRAEKQVPPYIINILNTNSPVVNTNTNIDIHIDIDIRVVNNISSKIKGEANYLLGELDKSNKGLTEALKKLIEFADDAKSARNINEVTERGWGRRLKSIIEVLAKSGDQLKKIRDGSEVLIGIYSGVKELAGHFHLHEIADLVSKHLI